MVSSQQPRDQQRGPEQNVYGGDEISALVLDPGSFSTRLGFAGEDTPKFVTSSCIGHLQDESSNISNGNTNKSSRLFFDQSSLGYPRPNFDVTNPWSDGKIKDWDSAAAFWRWGFNHRLSADLRENPIIMVEPHLMAEEDRVKSLEILFEDFEAPASFLAKSAVCSAFANGKSNSLLIDVGHSSTTISPIVEGYLLRKSVMLQPFAGKWLNERIQKELKDMNADLTPRYLIKKRGIISEISDGAKNKIQNCTKIAEYKSLSGISDSFHEYQVERSICEFKEQMCFIADVENGEDEPVDSSRSFELPSGQIISSSVIGRKLVEPLFNPTIADTVKEFGDKYLGIAQLAEQAIETCDVDLRAGLLNNIVVTGGTSLLQNFVERLQSDLSRIYPGNKIRLLASTNTIERKFGSWIGGSILSSLGLFHQLWISRKEYDENGPERLKLIEKRCK